MRPAVTVLTETELRALMPLDLAAVDCIAQAFRALATEPVAMPPVLRLDIPTARGEVDVKTAWIPGIDHFAIKISPGFFGNPAIGLPSTNGLMVVLSAQTGLAEALLLDNGYLTDLRTAAAGAVAADALAREDSATAAIIGAGMQARLQLHALTLVRPIRAARVWARDAEAARRYAAEMTDQLGLAVEPAATAAEAVDGADIVVTTTPAEAPILSAVSPGTHVTAMGSDAPQKNEVAPELLTAARYIPDSLSQTRIQGELHHAIAAGLVPASAQFPELGEILAGYPPGRTSARQITLADLTGTGVQDTAIATLALSRARAAGAGASFSV